ncbi:MAG: urate hydroxylase PuuD [Candidatus Binatia bacterium]
MTIVSWVSQNLLCLGFGKVFSARAAYIHVGAALGTIMAANVWACILPAQQAMVASIRAGQPPDLRLGARAKERSKHNTFIVVPLVMIMLANHFPTPTHAHDDAWAMLGALTLVGWAAAWLYRRH